MKRIPRKRVGAVTRCLVPAARRLIALQRRLMLDAIFTYPTARIEMTRKTLARVAIATMLCSHLPGGFAANKSSTDCPRLKSLLDVPAARGMEARMLEQSLPIGGKDGDLRYFNVDIDGDDVSDVLALSCPASSGMPADPCVLSVKLSSGRTAELREQRFYLARHRGRVYAVVNHRGPNTDIGKRKIYLLTASGADLICANL